MKYKKNQNSIGEWDEVLDQYLLGKLTNDEKRAFEEQCFENEVLFEELKLREEVYGLVEKESEILLADYLKQKKTRKNQNRNLAKIFESPRTDWMSYAFKFVLPIIVIFFFYGIIRLGSPLFVSKSYKHADIRPYDVYVSEHRSQTPEIEDDFKKGFELLFSSHRKVLGLFPHFDKSQVKLALSQLRRGYKATPDGSDRAKIAFFIGKAYLMNEDVANACSWFQSVTEQKNAGAFFVEEANRLLNILCN